MIRKCFSLGFRLWLLAGFLLGATPLFAAQGRDIVTSAPPLALLQRVSVVTQDTQRAHIKPLNISLSMVRKASAMTAHTVINVDIATTFKPKSRPYGFAMRYDISWLEALAPPVQDAEWECLSEALYFEARGETLRGQFAVAEVILNRVESPAFPNSICGVVNQGEGRKHRCQFSYNCDGLLEVITDRKIYERLGRIARVMMDGGRRDLTKGATYFHTSAVRPRWANAFVHITTIGVHRFYRDDRRA